MNKALLQATLSATAAAALLAGCGSDDDAKPSSAKTTDKVRISNYRYEPDRASVKAGMKILIANGDDAPHTVTDRGAARAFDSGTIKGKQNGTVSFQKPGTYAYFCEFHPTMAGKVTVTE
ncbi:MAG: cupredoxin domain-containing protein [Actinomycetota bacterium]|nr:cupredoxin domain-containing protein [Actinomycetota bacterium]